MSLRVINLSKAKVEHIVVTLPSCIHTDDHNNDDVVKTDYMLMHVSANLIFHQL